MVMVQHNCLWQGNSVATKGVEEHCGHQGVALINILALFHTNPKRLYPYAICNHVLPVMWCYTVNSMGQFWLIEMHQS